MRKKFRPRLVFDIESATVDQVWQAVRRHFPRGEDIAITPADGGIAIDAAEWLMQWGLISYQEALELLARRCVPRNVESINTGRNLDKYVRALAEATGKPETQVQDDLRAAIRRQGKKVLGALVGPQNVGRLKQEPHNDAQGDYTSMRRPSQQGG